MVTDTFYPPNAPHTSTLVTSGQPNEYAYKVTTATMYTTNGNCGMPMLAQLDYSNPLQLKATYFCTYTDIVYRNMTEDSSSDGVRLALVPIISVVGLLLINALLL